MIAARNFVGWYNGHPRDKDLNVHCILFQNIKINKKEHIQYLIKIFIFR